MTYSWNKTNIRFLFQTILHRAIAVNTFWQRNLSDSHYCWKVIIVLMKCTNTLYNPSIKSDWKKGACTMESLQFLMVKVCR